MHRTTLGRLTAVLILLIAITRAPRAYAQTSAPLATLLPGVAYTDSVDRALVFALSQADRNGIAMARGALPSLKDPDVKRFALRLIDDQDVNLTTTSAIATRLSYGLAAGTPAAAAAAAVGNTDLEFVTATITARQGLLDRFPPSGLMIKDEGLRLHFIETRQTVLAHLGEAKRLQTRLTPRTP